MLQISRACAAIDILDNYINGIPIEKALKEWFKNNRFAGSNDRRSIRDIIFDILRKRLILFYPFQINDYSENGRILVLSYLYIYKRDTFSLCDIVDNKYFLPPIKNKELLILNKINDYIKKAPKNILLSYPEFLEKKLKLTLGNDFDKVMKIFLERAPIYLRINNLKTNLKDEKSNLEKEAFDFIPNILNVPNILDINDEIIYRTFKLNDKEIQYINDFFPRKISLSHIIQ